MGIGKRPSGRRWMLLVYLHAIAASAKCSSPPSLSRIIRPSSKHSKTDGRLLSPRGGATALATKTMSSPQQLPEVKTLLVPRQVDRCVLARYVLLGWILVSGWFCLRTAGRPYQTAVNELIAQQVSEGGSLKALDLLRVLIETRHSEHLPPRFWPSVNSLLSLMCSGIVFFFAEQLLPRWFPAFYQVYMTHRPIQSSISGEHNLAVLVKLPREMRVYASQDRQTICPLHQTAGEKTKKERKKQAYHFNLGNQRYYCKITDGKNRNNQHSQTKFTVTSGAPTLDQESITSLLKAASAGLSKSKLKHVKNEFEEYNSKLTHPSPTLQKAFCDRISSPLVVLQLVGKLLRNIQNPFFYDIAFDLGHHGYNAYNSIRSAGELSREANVQDAEREKVRVKVQRNNKWKLISATKLLPGDVFEFFPANNKKDNSLVLPVDALIINGTAITNEAILTGETVPQTKIPIEESNDCLDMMGRHRSSILFAGTTMQQYYQDAASTSLRCLALRTGSYSSRGYLLGALHKSSTDTVLNEQTERDGLRLMASLAVVSVATCVWLWCFTILPDGASSPAGLTEKFLVSLRIILATIPTSLPMLIAGLGSAYANMLRTNEDVVCSDPSALLAASSIEHVLLDKTGTLTADTSSVAQIVVPPSILFEGNDNEEDPTNISFEDEQQLQYYNDAANLVLATCHSLVRLPKTKEWIGDPLDLACLKHVQEDWKFYTKNKFFRSNNVRVWQLKTFPFDPHLRTSSALILVQQEGNGDEEEFGLYRLIKGSPQILQEKFLHLDVAIKTNAQAIPTNAANATWYQDQITDFGREGYRMVGLGVAAVPKSDALLKQLFPSGLPKNKKKNEQAEVIKEAQDLAQVVVQRRMVEVQTNQFKFCGLVCFNARLRPSTPRVISQLKSRVGVSMLTGDTVEAAVAVAQRSNIISINEEDDDIGIALLDIRNNKLQWKYLGGVHSDKTRAFTQSSTSRIMSSGMPLVATGSAVEYLSLRSGEGAKSKATELVRCNWDKFQVFAKASPHQKVLVASNLKRIGKKILMCGDGVNDVAAMKIADCGVALLNGFEGDSSFIDLENERRLRKLRAKPIGSNRKKFRRHRRTEASARRKIVKKKIDEALRDVRAQAAKSQGIDNPDDPKLKLTSAEVKQTFNEVMRINKEERERRTLLRKGGAGAAKILAEEDKSMSEEQAQSSLIGQQNDRDDIKLGEASLVSSFSCLRPAIDGVESILRYGIAAAAYIQVVHHRMAEACTTHALNILTSYGHHIRFGKRMDMVELYIAAVQGELSNQASYSPRPTLSAASVPASFMNPRGIISILAQSVFHFVSHKKSLSLAKGLESEYPEPNPRQRLIQIRPDDPLFSPCSENFVLHYLRKALVEAPVFLPGDQKVSALAKLFQIEPFRPNYLTNVKFLHSVWTSTIAILVNHAGWPYYHRILEERKLIVVIAIPVFLVLSLIAEGTPELNKLLELRLMPHTQSRLELLAIFAADLIGCCLVSFLCQYRLDQKDDDDVTKPGDNSTVWASNEEEKLLKEETEDNTSFAKIIVSSMALIVVNLITKELAAQQSSQA